jgi:D-alanine-D-alanine ligase-like ATP-grasp enzyme
MSINLTRKVGLEVSGLDLMKDLEGNWYCFEMNPSPGFSFFQDRSGQSIDAAIADLLAGGTEE